MKIQGNRKCFTTVRHFILGAFAASVVMSSFNDVRAASSDQTFARVRREVAADPSHAEAILKKEIKSLSGGDCQRLTAGMFAAALDALGKPSVGEALNLFKVACGACHGSVGGLLDVVYQYYPSDIAAFVDEARACSPGFLDAITAFLAGHGGGNIPTTGALGGTINPANIGGSVLGNPAVSPSK